MWFKNLVIYQLEEFPELDELILTELIDAHQFKPCGPQQSNSIGWVSPISELSDQLCHCGSGMFLLSARREERILPAGVIREAVDEKVLEIQQREDRKVGRKQKMELRDELTFSMMPRAFTRSTRIHGLIMPEQQLIVVDSPSRAKAEEWLSLLRDSMGGLKVRPIEFKRSLTGLFTGWLLGSIPLPPQVEPADECELQSPKDSREVVQCRRIDLVSDEIKVHLDAGKMVIRMAVNWNQSLSFVINEHGEIKRLKMYDTMVEEARIDGSADEAAEFDARFTLMSLELSRFLPALWVALGGLETE